MGDLYPNIKPEDVRIFSWESKSRSAWSLSIPRGVHIIHIPTGNEVKCDSERSQHKNKHLALIQLNKILEKANGGGE